MTFVNYFIPFLIKFASEYEEWDFMSEIIYTDLWKNFYTSMFNMIFFILVQLDGFFSSENDEIEGSIYECKEDIFVDNILKLFISEVILRYAYYFYWLAHYRVK